MAARNTKNTKYNDRPVAAPYNYGTAAPKLYPNEPAPKKRSRVKSQPQPKESGVGYLIFFTIITAALLAAGIIFLSVRSEITSTQNQIESLQKELQVARTNNDATEVLLSKSVDLANVYKIATGELGMVYPSNEQIIYYKRNDVGFARQYEGIPND